MRYLALILLASCGLPAGVPAKAPPYNFQLGEGTKVAFAGVVDAVNRAISFELLKEGIDRPVAIELNTKEVLEFQKRLPGAVANFADDHIYIHAGVAEYDTLLFYTNVMMHEVGHSLGLAHNDADPASIMNKDIPTDAAIEDNAQSLRKELCDQLDFHCN